MVRQSPVLAPKRLFFQIVGLQTVYYGLATLMITFALLVQGLSWAPHYIFAWEDVRADTSLGWLLAMLWLLDAVFSVLALVVIVGRSKLVTDFALTLYGIHVVVVVLVTKSVPRSWLWWAVQGVSGLLTVYAGRWASQWRELQRTFFEDFELAEITREQA